MTRYLLTLVALVCVGCAGTYQHTLEFNPGEPLRVAVLPFQLLDTDGKVTNEESRLVVDSVALVSSKIEETPPQIVRRLVLADLEKSGLDVVTPVLIDLDLPHRGFGRSDGTLDLQKVINTDPKELCTKFLNCDAVMYGTVTRWDRSYYGIQTVNTVGVSLNLVSAKNKKVLFSASAVDSESRGITKIPTGFSSLVLEPIRGLNSEIILDLARSTVSNMLNPLKVTSRPEFLTDAPPAIFASSNDARGSSVSRDKGLVVVMFGSPGQSAKFAIGNSIDIPMVERTPGHYYGEYIPLEGDSFRNEKVVVSLSDAYGRTTTQTISKDPISLGNV